MSHDEHQSPSHQHDHDDCNDHDEHGGHHGEEPGGGSGDTRFLDLEISKVMYSEAEGVTRDAFRELLKDAAKERMRERMGERIDALATLAVDELLDDLDANLAIEDRIAERSAGSKDAVARARAIIRGDD